MNTDINDEQKQDPPGRVTDTGSSYPAETKNDDNKDSSLTTNLNKSMTIPSPAKPIEDLKNAMIQFRSILRISNVSVDEFLDSIVFKNDKFTITYLEFKLGTEGILKNHTFDFANYAFNGSPMKNKDQLNDILSSLHYDFDDYIDERLYNEIKDCKMTLKDAFEVEDTKDLGYVNIKQLEEVVSQLDLNFDNGKPFII